MFIQFEANFAQSNFEYNFYHAYKQKFWKQKFSTIYDLCVTRIWRVSILLIFIVLLDLAFDLHVAHLFWTPQLKFMSKITSLMKQFELWHSFYVTCMLTILQRPSIRLLKRLNFSVCKQNLLKGGFQLRKWESNDINLQKNIREKETNNSNFSSNPSTDDTT